MKKLISLLIAVILLLSVFAVTVFAAETDMAAVGDGDLISEGDEDGDDGDDPPAPLLGDVDGDRTITVVDATFIQRKLLSFDLPFVFIENVADTDRDGSVTIIDATMIQRRLLNLPSNDKIGQPLR